MATTYRNGTYIAFHAEGTTDPIDTDMKYYNILKAWAAHDKIEFEFVNSHDKTAAVRDSSKRSTLEASLKTRLLRSKNMILVVGETTKLDKDWVPFEIKYAVDECKIPLIIAYTGYTSILNPSALRSLWPTTLADRIDNGTAKAIHIPFKKEAILDAISRFGPDNLPGTSLNYYKEEVQKRWGYL